MKMVSFLPTDSVPNTLHKLYSENLLLGDHLYSLILELSFAIFSIKEIPIVALNHWTFSLVHRRSKFLLFMPWPKAARAAGAAPSTLSVLAVASREEPAVIALRAGRTGSPYSLKPPGGSNWETEGHWPCYRIRVHSREDVAPQSKCDCRETLFRPLPCSWPSPPKPQHFSSKFCLLSSDPNNKLVECHLINTKKNKIKQNQEYLF